MNVRVRYAPSPTGLQHVGSVRTALFNYLFARASGGVFVLRIEDTDRERLRADALQDIYDTFRWLGMSWDEGPDKGGPYGPYVQSERRETYRQKTDELLAKGAAYKCFCTPERLEKLREEQAARKAERTGYDRHCRNLTAAEVAAQEAEGKPHVVRLKVPTEGTTTYHDQLLGDVTVPNQDINPDPVLLKSDGYPTYHLANVVDDHLMEISHILRAQEWLASVPLHVQLYKAFGWAPPLYCHLPMVLGADGHKLSKRHGAVSVLEFRKQGYLPEAMLNYIALVGWALDDSTEFFTKEELEKVFSLERLNKSPAVFDYQKLGYFNGAYIRKKSDAELAALVRPYLARRGDRGRRHRGGGRHAPGARAAQAPVRRAGGAGLPVPAARAHGPARGRHDPEKAGRRAHCRDPARVRRPLRVDPAAARGRGRGRAAEARGRERPQAGRPADAGARRGHRVQGVAAAARQPPHPRDGRNEGTARECHQRAREKQRLRARRERSKEGE